MNQFSVTGGKRVVVLGGGISGLSFLHYIRVFASAFRKEHLLDKIILVEANDYLGGSIKSKVYEDGVVHELGPRFIRSHGLRSKSTMALSEHLGLDRNALVLDTKSSKSKQIYTSNNKIEPLPESMMNLFTKLPGTNTRVGKAVFHELFRAPKMDLSKYPDEDPPLHDFVSHRFGQEVADEVLDPIMRGVNAGDCKRLSTRALIAEFLDQEQTYGSMLKGMMKPPVRRLPYDDLYAGDILNSKFVSRNDKERLLSYTFRGGLGNLPERLANSLINNNPDNKVNIYNQTKAISVDFENDGDQQCAVLVETVDGDRIKIEADHIVSAMPSTDFVQLFTRTLPSDEKTIWDDIVDVPHRPVATICIEYSDAKLKEQKNLQTAGFLTHSKSDARVLSVSYDSTVLPDDDPNVFKLNVMIGGDWFNSVLGTTDVNSVSTKQLEDIALADVRRIAKIEGEPKRMTTQLWKTGIAQYRPGHQERIDRTRANVKRLGIPLTLIGQSYDGIAINDVVFGARMAANDFIKNLCDK